MDHILPAWRVAATDAALRKVQSQHGAGARFGEWLLRTYAFQDGQPTDLKSAEARIAEDWGVSDHTAWRWRSGHLPPMPTLEEMHARWGMPFVAFLFDADATAEQRDTLWRLRELEGQTGGVPAIRERERQGLRDALRRLGAEQPSRSAATLLADLVRAEARKTFGGRFRLLVGRALA
ncbi:hypothetical protein [Azospirillum sp. B506]|uniref:hypothetical protein n=1 Tax=Azospirillum sp. B506 TaxID=137721 RepID=UPI0011DE4EB8|nr:hypothetical protein [Azospirillum sp. B506]